MSLSQRGTTKPSQRTSRVDSPGHLSDICACRLKGDSNHSNATALFRRALDDVEDILVHNYILVEAAALLQHRLGITSALQLLRDADAF